MKCGNEKCKWHGGDGGCRLFAGAAIPECKYRVAAAKAAPAKTTAARKGTQPS